MYNTSIQKESSMNISKIISQPSVCFNSPDDILRTDKLNNKEKLKALQNWKNACIQLQESTSEGMTGGAQDEELEMVSETLRKLEEKGIRR